MAVEGRLTGTDSLTETKEGDVVRAGILLLVRKVEVQSLRTTSQQQFQPQILPAALNRDVS